MLVLSRKKEEEIIIGNNVVLKVLEICGDKVKLGFTAPDAVTIMRGELVAAKEKKKDNGLERQTT
jgi:carbon storage regulator